MWHQAICKAIIPFTDNTKDIETFIVRLSYKNGCNIRMIIMPRKDSNKILLANKIDFCFKNFLLETPSASADKLLVESSIFLNFKNNSIHYGTFEYIVDIYDNNCTNVFLIYEREISKVIFELFKCYKEETIENIIEISIQLIFIFCNALNINTSDSKIILDTLLRNEYLKYEPEAAENLNLENSMLYDDNKDSIVKCLIENRNNDLNDYKEKWQILWYLTVVNCKISLMESKNKNLSFQDYSLMINILFTSLDLQYRSTVCYFVSNALKEILSNES